MTGEIKWKSRGSGHDSASMASADGHLYIHYADGTMTLVKASPDGFEETGHFEVPGSGERPVGRIPWCSMASSTSARGIRSSVTTSISDSVAIGGSLARGSR